MVRWGILSLGNIAGRFSEALEQSSGGILYAVASRSEHKREQYTSKYDCVAYASYEALLQDEQVDVVYIALPHKFHLQWCEKAMQAGKAVLCEKPAAIEESQVIQMVHTAEKYNVFFMEAMKARFLPGRKIIHEVIESGTIGQIETVSANFCANVDATAPKECYYYDPAQGGPILDMGPYPAAFIMDIMKEEAVSAECEMTVDENGVEHHATGYWQMPSGRKAFFEVAFDEDKPREAVIIGTNGKIVVPYYYRAEKFEIHTMDGKVKEVLCGFDGSDMLGEIEEVQYCLKNNLLQSPAYSWEESLVEIRMLTMAKRAGKKRGLEKSDN